MVDDHECGARARQVQNQRRRNRIEPLRVIDAQHQRSLPGLAPQGVRGPLHQLERVIGARRSRDRRHKRPKRKTYSAPRGLNPVNSGAGVLRGVHCVPRQPRLADPGRAAQDDGRAVLGPRQRDLLQLACATHQRR